ncbi:MAG: hypothetical protein IKL68_02775 [Clostridia bacterium]|nr:hypothetical protein [Clostridia bacterium]
MKNRKGISLIVLVITIIVMIILASAVIVTLNNDEIVDKANTAVKKNNEQQVKQLAALVWADVSMEGYVGEQLENEVIRRLEEEGIYEEDWDITVTEEGVKISQSVPRDTTALNPTGVIPAGATYTQYINGRKVYDSDESEYLWLYDSVVTYNAGQNFPSTINSGDVYTYGDYEYCYNWPRKIYADWGNITTMQSYQIEGWGVYYIGTEGTPTDMLESINGKPITSINAAFANNTNLIDASVVDIPSTVTDMMDAFAFCSNLTKAPKIPNDVENMFCTFQGCKSLISAPKIPESVTNIANVFNDCLSLTGKILLPCSQKTGFEGFLNCSGTIEFYHITNCSRACGA